MIKNLLDFSNLNTYNKSNLNQEKEMEGVEFKVWYSQKDETFPRELTIVEADSFEEAQSKVQNELGVIVQKIVDAETGLELPQLTKYKELQANRYRAKWYGNEEEKDISLTELVNFEYYRMPNIEYTNKAREWFLTSPNDKEKLPDHLLKVVNEEKTHGGKREGAGRPSLGTTKKVSITLPDEVWESLEKEKGSLPMSAYLREIIMGGNK